MDALSDVFAVMRTGKPRAARAEWHAPWGQRFPAVPGAAGFRIVISGPCWFIPQDGEPFALEVGDVVFLPHAVRHGLADSPTTPIAEHAGVANESAELSRERPGRRAGHASSATTVTVCGAYQLDSARVHPLLSNLPAVVHVPARPGHADDLRAAVHLLAAELQRPAAGTDALVPALLDTLLLYILRASLPEPPVPEKLSGWSAALADPAISVALEAIHHDPARPWTVAELGACAGLSRAAFSRRFTALVGQPPLAYLTWWRLTRAMWLLRASDSPLSAIAEKVGYKSEFAFASAFKREFDVAPGRYRRSERAVGQQLPETRSQS